MNYSKKRWSKYENLSFWARYTTGMLFMICLLAGKPVHAQERQRSSSLGIHAGINAGMFGGGMGPGVSLHYALGRKALQFESMLFFDSRSGSTWYWGESEKSRGAGLLAGGRFNFLPGKNWNPSLVVMLGVMYGATITEAYQATRRDEGICPAVSLGIANTLFQKHMISLGFTSGEYFASIYLKYGLWF
jgi:hypothetical protein